jgi:hypothetical protein
MAIDLNYILEYSKTGATIYYQGKEFRSLKGAGFKANYYEVGTGDEYWISGRARMARMRFTPQTSPRRLMGT